MYNLRTNRNTGTNLLVNRLYIGTRSRKSCFLYPKRAVQNGRLSRKIALPFQGEENIRERYKYCIFWTI
jgi:hypothetical protein